MTLRLDKVPKFPDIFRKYVPLSEPPILSEFKNAPRCPPPVRDSKLKKRRTRRDTK